jgi:exopolysaccharide production protein ExoQ
MALNVFERVFVVLFLLASMGVEIGLTRPYESETDPGAVTAAVHVTDVVVESGLEVCGILLIFLRWRRFVAAVRAVWPLVGLAVLAMASTAWSGRPDLTLRRSALLLVSMLIAIYAGERFEIKEQVGLLTYMFGAMIMTIVVLRFVAPPYVVDYVSHPGAWKGLSGYKNAFGQYMAIAALLLLLARFQYFRWLRYLFLGVAVGFLVLSQSAGSLLCLVLIVPLMPLWRSNRVQGRQRLPVYTMIGLGLFSVMDVFMTHSGRLFNLLGRNSTLTGRTQLWASVWDAIMKRPLLGYGYDTFWAGMGEALDVRIGAGWMAQRSDNGFLDLGLSLGMVGVCLFLIIFALSFWKALEYIRLEHEPYGLWPITYLVFYLLHNMAESTLLTRGTFPDLLFIMIVTALALNRRRPLVADASLEMLNESEFLSQVI